MTEPANPRLVVELSTQTRSQLAELVEVEGLNKTTIVNRAVHLYHLVTTNQRSGGKLLLQEPDGSVDRVTII
jgi:hypothetical protein